MRFIFSVKKNKTNIRTSNFWNFVKLANHWKRYQEHLGFVLFSENSSHVKKKYFNTRKIFFLVSASKWFLRSSKVKMKWILLASWIIFQLFRIKKDFIIIGKTFGKSGHLANRTRNAFESWTRGKFSQRWPQTQLRSVAYSSNFLAIIYNEAKFSMKYHSHTPAFSRQTFSFSIRGSLLLGLWKNHTMQNLFYISQLN